LNTSKAIALCSTLRGSGSTLIAANRQSRLPYDRMDKSTVIDRSETVEHWNGSDDVFRRATASEYLRKKSPWPHR
jgi:hypothetical protein